MLTQTIPRGGYVSFGGQGVTLAGVPAHHHRGQTGSGRHSARLCEGGGAGGSIVSGWRVTPGTSGGGFTGPGAGVVVAFPVAGARAPQRPPGVVVEYSSRLTSRFGRLGRVLVFALPT